MGRWLAILGFGFLMSLLPLAADACSLCAVTIKKDTLGQEMERAKIVLYGHVANPQFNTLPGAAAGSGTSDFHIEKVLKTDPFLGDSQVVKLDRYIPVADPKNPPRYLVFCDVFKGKLNTYHGRSLDSLKLLEYLESARSQRTKDRVEALVFYAQYLDHADPAIAEDAFMEFAKSNDEEVGRAAKRLDPERIRTLLKQCTDADRVSLYAFLLGASGGDKDATILRGLIERPTPEMRKALDGLFCGYITLKPREGWDAAFALAADRKKDYVSRFAVLRACRFQYNWKPKESRAELVRIYKEMVADPEMADLAIDDLRRWQIWDLTTDILSYFGKDGHDAPITHRNIARYALCSPQPEARQFIERLRQKDRELVTDLEEAIMFEKGK